jgi:hypothetical protein
VERFLIGSPVSVAFSVTFTLLSLTAQTSSQAKAFPATLARVTRARAPCSIRFWMSLDPAPTLLCVRKGRAVGSVCDSRAKYFFKLSTHTIVYLQSHVHNRDIATSVKSFFSETLRVFQRDCAAGLGAHCAVAVARTTCSNENPGAAAGVLHSLRIVLSAGRKIHSALAAVQGYSSSLLEFIAP